MARTRLPVKAQQKVAESIQEKEHEFPTTQEYIYVDEKLERLLSDKFNYFEKYGGNISKDGIHYYSGNCRRSSFNPQVLNFSEYYNDVEQLIEFANITQRDVSLNYNFYKDTKNTDVTIIPLIALVTSNDNHQILMHSKMELPNNLQIKDVCKYAYECCFVDKIWILSSEPICETVFNFFLETFVNEGDHI